MVDADGSGLVTGAELKAFMKKHSLAQKGGKGPSPKQIIDMCDTDESGGLTIDEAHACIDAHISDEEKNAEAHDIVDEGFADADKDGNGEVDRKELKAAMKAHKKGALA